MSRRPNILLICTDQQRYDSLGVNGNTICRTGNIDRLAAEGMNFTHAFTVCSLCSPARASLMTGLYPHRHGVIDNTNARDVLQRDLREDAVTFSQLLRNSGYRTGYVGKWHVGKDKTPLDWGFDDFVPGEGWHEWYPDGVTLENGSDIGLAYAPEKPMAARVPLPLEKYPEYNRTSDAVDLLGKYAEGENPFFMRLDFFGPHYPHYLPDPYATMYEASGIPPWPNAKAIPDIAHAGEQWLRHRWPAPDDNWPACAQLIAYYYGHVTFIDHQVGRVLEAVDRLGLAENTLVIFVSDHGDMTGAHGLLQKGAVSYDELYKIPLVMRWPGKIEAGSTSDEMVRLFDLMPTFLESARAAVPSNLDACSLVPLLGGDPPTDWPNHVFAEYLGTQRGDTALKIVRTRNHKLSVNLTEIDELYDLDSDPGESLNRIHDPTCQEIRHTLSNQLMAWMEQSHDPMATRFSERLSL
jgi:arylsulfatase A-like enzyme